MLFLRASGRPMDRFASVPKTLLRAVCEAFQTSSVSIVSKGIRLGALVCLVDSDDKQQLFLGPDGGSMTLVSGAQLVQVISSEAPLGRAMLGKCEGDEVSIQIAPIRQHPTASDSSLRYCGFIEPQESPLAAIGQNEESTRPAASARDRNPI